MDDLETRQPPEKVFDPDLFRSKINQVLAGQHDWQNDEEPANYDAIFDEGKEPFIINVWNKKRGSGLGYVVFHDFLTRVGKGEIFSTSDMSEDGEKLFQKAVEDGLIEQTSEKTGFHRASRWKVLGDPKANLKKIRSELDGQ